MRTRQGFPLNPASITAARHYVGKLLADQSADSREAVELMVSEVVTNSIRHAQTGFTIEVKVSADQVRVTVTDRGAGDPQVQSPAPTEPTGRGLQIVDDLARGWGVRASRRGQGKSVWFTYSLSTSRDLCEAGPGDRAGG